jgi:biopolymer transport protein ExbD
MAMAAGGAKGPRAEINVTPMIDVLLVLLIIFMIITPLAPVGLPALVPQPSPPDRQEASRPLDFVISVRMDGSILLNQEPVDLANLGARLEQVFRRNYDHVIFVRGDRDLEFGAVARVLDIASGAGLKRIALMTT